MRDDSKIFWLLFGACEKTTQLEGISDYLQFYISSTEEEPNEWNEQNVMR